MIFHIKTKTAIFLPTKTGSVSLTYSVHPMIDDFHIVYGPAYWSETTMTPHVCSNKVNRVNDALIEQRYLLFREPLQRTISLYRFLIDRNEITCSFSDWVNTLFEIKNNLGGWQSQASYCKDYQGVIRSEHMIEDIEKLTGIKIPVIRYNRSQSKYPNVQNEDIRKIEEIYKDDFEILEKLKSM